MDAVAFAAEKHRHQRRKDAEASPYINHPIALARTLAVEGHVEDVTVLVAAVLHDTLEDTETTVEEIERRFGAEVAGIVKEVTDDKALPKEQRKELQVAHAPHLSPRAKLVKLADKISNLRDIQETPPGDWLPDRKRAYFDWAANVVAGLRGLTLPWSLCSMPSTGRASPDRQAHPLSLSFRRMQSCADSPLKRPSPI